MENMNDYMVICMDLWLNPNIMLNEKAIWRICTIGCICIKF